MKPDPDPWLDPLIEDAPNNEVVARALVRHLAICLEHGTAPPPALAAYFAAAFREVARGRSADEKLHLHPKKSDAGFERDYKVAGKVWRLINHRGENGLSREVAFNKVADEESMSDETVKKIYDRMKHLLKLEDYEIWVETLEPGDPRREEAPDVPEELREEMQRRRNIISALLADALNRRRT